MICKLLIAGLFIFASIFSFAQEEETTPAGESAPTPAARGSIPEVLLRPARGEAPRYPVDTVIGDLGRGQASEAAFTFANTICEGLLSGDADHADLATANSNERQRYIAYLDVVSPSSYRIGGGRQEADGAFSFLVRFIGRDKGVSGELYVRFGSRQNRSVWIFEELLLDEVRDRNVEQQESLYRYDFNPYERFF